MSCYADEVKAQKVKSWVSGVFSDLSCFQSSPSRHRWRTFRRTSGSSLVLIIVFEWMFSRGQANIYHSCVKMSHGTEGVGEKKGLWSCRPAVGAAAASAESKQCTNRIMWSVNLSAAESKREKTQGMGRTHRSRGDWSVRSKAAKADRTLRAKRLPF